MHRAIVDVGSDDGWTTGETKLATSTPVVREEFEGKEMLMLWRRFAFYALQSGAGE